MTLNYKRRVSGIYWDNGASQNGEMDYSKSIGADCYDMYLTKGDVSNLHYQTDYIATGIAYAHSIGMKYIIRISEYSYGVSGNWSEFVNNPTEQTLFLSDFEWILNRYPGLDGIEIEESEGYLGTTLAQTWRDFKNQFLAKEKAIVMKYHSVTDGSFQWGINSGNSYFSDLYNIGYDIDYIKNNNLVNAWFFQILQGTTSLYNSRIDEAAAKFSGSAIALGAFSYVYSSAFTNACETSPQASCFNLGLFDNVKYTLQKGFIPSIFIVARLRYVSGSWYPAPYSSLGATAGAILSTFWGTAPAPIGFPVPCGIIGDVDGDGIITQADVDLASQLLLSGGTLTADQIKRIDVNGDGVANLNDLVLLKQYSLGQITTFPACNPPCISSGYICEQPLNGYEKDNCGNRRLNTACNPPPVLNSIVISPSMIQINQGQETAVTVKAIDSNGVAVPGVPVIITSDPTGIITTNPTQGGTFTDGTITITVKGLIPGLTALKAASGSIVGISTIDVNSNPCISAWVCEVPLNGWEKDGCGNRRLNPVCNVPGPTDDKTEQVIFVAIAIGAALSKL